MYSVLIKKINVILLIFVLSVKTLLYGNVADSLVNVLDKKEFTIDEKLQIYFDICNDYYKRDYTKGLLYAKEGLVLAVKHNNIKMTTRLRTWVGIGYMFTNEYDKAHDTFDEALAEAKKSNDLKQEGYIYGSIAELYQRQLNLEQAIEYHLKAKKINEELGDKRLESKYLNNIASLHLNLNNIDRAYDYLKEAEAIVEELEYKYGKVGIYYNLGYIHYKRKEYDKALNYEFKAWEVSRELNEKYFEAISLGVIADIYIELEDYEKAREFSENKLFVAESLGFNNLTMSAYSTLAGVIYKQKIYADSEEIALKGFRIDSTSNNILPSLVSIIVMSNIQLGNKDKALKYLDVYQELLEKRTEENMNRNILELEEKYENEKKQVRINSLEKERSFILVIAILSCVLLLLTILLLILRQRIHKQKRKIAEQQVEHLQKEKKLVATQALLEGENTERTRLARDLHDGLGGLLSVVKLNLDGMHDFSVIENEGVERFDKAINVLDQSIIELRRVAHHMMPESLFRHGLKVSLADFCNAIPGANFHYMGNDERLESSFEVLLYRAAYELVNNAVKHAQAHQINIQLIIDNGVTALTVHDDGIGFNPEMISEGMGLANILTRVEAYGGRMNIHTFEGKGTEVSLEFEV